MPVRRRSPRGWIDLDFNRMVIHVRRQVRIVGNRLVFAPPKGDKDRDVALSDELAACLQTRIRAHPPQLVTLPWLEPGGRPESAQLLFLRKDGGPLRRTDFNRYTWQPAVVAAGLPGGRQSGFHQLRHHFASTLLSAGADIRDVAVALGHQDWAFTIRTYGHLAPGSTARVRRVMNGLPRPSERPDSVQG